MHCVVGGLVLKFGSIMLSKIYLGNVENRPAEPHKRVDELVSELFPHVNDLDLFPPFSILPLLKSFLPCIYKGIVR